MGSEVTPFRYPWEPALTEQPLEETVWLLQRDFATAVQYTAIMVHSTREEFRMLVNTRRGQIIPRGECKFTDGTTVEFQDIGMPQVNCEVMTVAEIMNKVLAIATELGMEL